MLASVRSREDEKGGEELGSTHPTSILTRRKCVLRVSRIKCCATRQRSHNRLQDVCAPPAHEHHEVPARFLDESIECKWYALQSGRGRGIKKEKAEERHRDRDRDKVTER